MSDTSDAAKVVVTNTAKSTFPVLGLVGLIFVICKVLAIGEIATWSWWLVLLPFYFWLAVLAGFMVIVLVGTGLVFAGAAVFDYFANRRRRLEREKRAREYKMRNEK